MAASVIPSLKSHFAARFSVLLLAGFLAFISDSSAMANDETLGLFDYVLGSDDAFDMLNLKTGYVDASESRFNKFGERSTVSYHLKPYDSKLKVRVDHSCFSVKCYDGHIILAPKHTQHRLSSFSEHCLFSSVTSLTSSAHFTGRFLAFSNGRPSISDVRPGDILYGDLKCGEDSTPSAWRITSFYHLSSRGDQSALSMFQIAFRPASLLDVASNGDYSFYTDNLLTVNDVKRDRVMPRLFDREWADSFSQDLVDMVRSCYA